MAALSRFLAIHAAAVVFFCAGGHAERLAKGVILLGKLRMLKQKKGVVVLLRYVNSLKEWQKPDDHLDDSTVTSWHHAFLDTMARALVVR